MTEHPQDLQEVVKVEVPTLRELSVDRICYLLNKVTESDQVFANQHYNEDLSVTIDADRHWS